MDELLDEACASTQVTPKNQIRPQNTISKNSSQVDTKSSLLPNFNNILSRGPAIKPGNRISPSPSQMNAKFSNYCANVNDVNFRDSRGYETAVKNLIITYRREVAKLKHEIDFLSKKLESGGIASCPSCNHKFRHRDNLVLPKYIKVLRGRLMLEIEFASIDCLEEWLTLNSFEDAAGGYATLRKSEVPTTLKGCESQLKNLLNEEALNKDKIRIPLKNDAKSSSSMIGVNQKTNNARTGKAIVQPPKEVKNLGKKELQKKRSPIALGNINALGPTSSEPNLNVRTDEKAQVADNYVKERKDIEHREPRITAEPHKENKKNEAMSGRYERETRSKKSIGEETRKSDSHAKADDDLLTPNKSHKEVQHSRKEEGLRRSPRKQKILDNDMEIKARVDRIVERRRNIDRNGNACDRSNRNHNNTSTTRGVSKDKRIGRNDYQQNRNQSRNPRLEPSTSVAKRPRRDEVSSNDRSQNSNRNTRGGNHRPSVDNCGSSMRTSDRLNARSAVKRKASPVASYSKRVRENTNLPKDRRFNTREPIQLDERRSNSSGSRRSRSHQTPERKRSSTSVDTPHNDFEELIEVDATDTVEPESLCEDNLTVPHTHPSSTPSSVFSMPTSVTSRLIIDEDVEDGEVLTDDAELDPINTTLNRSLTTPNRDPLTSPPPELMLKNSPDLNVCESANADVEQSTEEKLSSIDKEVYLNSSPCNKNGHGTSYDEPELITAHVTSEDEPQQENISPLSCVENNVSAKVGSSLPSSTDVNVEPEFQVDDPTIVDNYEHVNTVEIEQSESVTIYHTPRRNMAPIKVMRKESDSIHPSSSSSDESENVDQDNKSASDDSNGECDGADDIDKRTAKPDRSSESSSNSDSDCFGGIAVDNEEDIFSDGFEPKSSGSEQSDFFTDSEGGSDNESID